MSKEPSKNSSLNIVAKVLGGEVTIYTLTTTNKQSLYYRFKDLSTRHFDRGSTNIQRIMVVKDFRIEEIPQRQKVFI